MQTGTTGEEVTIIAADGYRLAATLFSSGKPRQSIIVAPATGVRRQIYYGFCQWLAEQQFTVITLDFRGIGGSKLKGSLRGSKIRKQDWGQLDLEAAFQWLKTTNSNLPVSLIGNSAGGQLIGLMASAAKLKQIVHVAGSSGYVGNMPLVLHIQSSFLLRVYMPIASAIFGYVPTKWVGWGEDLPLGVAKQWGKWCLSPGYVENEFGQSVKSHNYNKITAAILSLYASDDKIAVEANIDDHLRLYTNAPQTKKRLDPDDLGLKSIGHIGFFSRRNKTLWPLAADWLL